MKTDAIHDCVFCENEFAFKTDLLPVTKLEFGDDRPKYSDVKVVRVEFAGSGDKQVLIRRRSRDERRPSDSTLR
jgi:hypothetical protein